MTLKVYMTCYRQAANETNVLGHLNSINSSHPGSALIRKLRASFELPGETGPHVCLVHEPLGLSLAEIREIAGGKIPESMLKPMIKMLLLGLDFLHSKAHVVHTGQSLPLPKTLCKMLNHFRYPRREFHALYS